MTSWYAVAVGVAVLVVGNLVGILIPGIGQLGAALVGGGAAGYVAGGGFRRGLWHGMLTGLVPGVVVVVGLIVAILLLDLVFRPMGMLSTALGFPAGGPIFTVAAFAVILLLTLGAYVVVSGIGGTIGGVLKDR